MDNTQASIDRIVRVGDEMVALADKIADSTPATIAELVARLQDRANAWRVWTVVFRNG